MSRLTEEELAKMERTPQIACLLCSKAAAEIRESRAENWDARKEDGQVIHDLGSRATDLQLRVEAIEAENAGLREIVENRDGEAVLTVLDERDASYDKLQAENAGLMEKVEQLEEAATMRKIADAGIGTVPVGIKRLEQLKAEKERRIYFQNIVYDVCNILDTKARKVVCGTVDDPSTEVQDEVKQLEAENAGLRKYVQHKANCLWYNRVGLHSCNCGLDELLKTERRRG